MTTKMTYLSTFFFIINRMAKSQWMVVMDEFSFGDMNLIIVLMISLVENYIVDALHATFLANISYNA